MLNGIHVIGQIDGIITDYAFPIITNADYFAKHLNNAILFIDAHRVKWNYLKINIPNWTGYLKLDEKNPSHIYFNDLLWTTKTFDNYTYIDLEGDFENYISKLGSKTRVDARKYLKIFESYHFIFEIIEGNELINALPELIKLNNNVWSVFEGLNNSNAIFLDLLIHNESKIKNGKIIMPVLIYEGKIIASVLGFLNKERCFLHTAGNQRAKVKYLSPGITLYILLIKKLSEMNIKTLDLSPGIEEYKLRLNAKIETITQPVIFKDRFSQIIYLLGQFVINSSKTLISCKKCAFKKK